MKINIAYPVSGSQKQFDYDDDRKIRAFMDKRISDEIPADELGEQFKGYVLKITGGNDKSGIPMKQGVAVKGRVRLLLNKDSGCYRPRKHKGERKRKTIRGCIVGNDLAVIHTIIVKKGEEEIPGLTDTMLPRRLGPKRASKIRKLFNLGAKEDPRDYVVKRTFVDKKGTKRTKFPKVQRLVTAVTVARRRRERTLKKRRWEKAQVEAQEYAKLLKQRLKERREASHSKRSQRKSAEAAKKPAAAAKPEKKVADKKAAPAKAAPAKGAAAGKGAAAKGGDKKGAAAAPAKERRPRGGAKASKGSKGGAKGGAKSVAKSGAAKPAKK